MAEPVLATSELKKKYGEVVAVDGVSWSVPQGSVFGLLGPNGAGKTTMIGMLLGLIKPDSGTISLFGDSGPPERSLPKIGAIMETPAFYPYLSGRDNLRYFQGISTHEDPAEIDRLLELVSLSRRADSKFSTYSLGMKHRLGIAYSLLGDPPLLLLDEPTNGLDPSGMAEVRSVIKELGSGDRTIVLASHLLNEVEQVCDSVAILSNGSLVAQGPVSELIDRSDRLRVDTTDNQHAARILGDLDWVGSVLDRGGALVVSTSLDRAANVTRALAAAGVFVSEMVADETSLEEYFLDVVGEAPSEGGSA